MPKYKSNHFIGRAVVSLFANQQGQVYYWEKEEGRSTLEPRNPRSVHSLDYLYAKWDENGRRDSSAETELQNEIDNAAPEVIRKLIRRFNETQAFELNEIEKEFLSRLLVRTVLRNPMMLDFFGNTFRAKFAMQMFRISRWIKRGRRRDAAYERYGRNRVLKGELNSFAATANVDRLVSQISDRGFQFILAAPDTKNFVLGSQPYLFNDHTVKDDPHGVDEEYGREVYLVLHPRVMLRVHFGGDSSTPEFIDDEDRKRINGLFIKYSSSVAACSPMDLDGAWYWPSGKENTAEIQRVEIKF